MPSRNCYLYVDYVQMHSWMDTYSAHSDLLSQELFKKDVDNTIGVYSHMMKPLARCSNGRWYNKTIKVGY